MHKLKSIVAIVATTLVHAAALAQNPDLSTGKWLDVCKQLAMPEVLAVAEAAQRSQVAHHLLCSSEYSTLSQARRTDLEVIYKKVTGSASFSEQAHSEYQKSRCSESSREDHQAYALNMIRTASISDEKARAILDGCRPDPKPMQCYVARLSNDAVTVQINFLQELNTFTASDVSLKNGHTEFCSRPVPERLKKMAGGPASSVTLDLARNAAHPFSLSINGSMEGAGNQTRPLACTVSVSGPSCRFRFANALSEVEDGNATLTVPGDVLPGMFEGSSTHTGKWSVSRFLGPVQDYEAQRRNTNSKDIRITDLKFTDASSAGRCRDPGGSHPQPKLSENKEEVAWEATCGSERGNYSSYTPGIKGFLKYKVQVVTTTRGEEVCLVDGLEIRGADLKKSGPQPCGS